MRFLIPIAALLAGCTYTEDALEHKDLHGTLRIPKEAVQLTLEDSTYNTWEIDDKRALGPVYIGVYASVQDGLYPYPHPEQGPVLDDNQEPNSYPYGGTTVGRFHGGCYEQTVCKMVTGRFSDLEDVIDYFANSLHDPIVDGEGNPVGPDEYREYCFEEADYTSENELDFIGDVDFEEDGDYLVAEFDILHTLFREGVTVWGWVDMPSQDYDFLTCDPESGNYFYWYDDQHYEGTNQSFVLNRPGDYIDSGDWVTDEPAVITDPDQDFEITMGYHYVE